MATAEWRPNGRPTPAGIYDALVDGKDNFAADREVARAITAISPEAVQGALSNRRFIGRAVTWAVIEGARQLIDLGCGYSPIAYQAAKDTGTRVALIDSDPMVACHADALYADAIAVKADLRDAERVLGACAAGGFIDFGQPLILVLGAVLQYFRPDEARQVVAAYLPALAPDSAVVISSPACSDAGLSEGILGAYPAEARHHTRSDFASFFDGLEMVKPGIATARSWRPGWAESAPPGGSTYVLAGVGIKR